MFLFSRFFEKYRPIVIKVIEAVCAHHRREHLIGLNEEEVEKGTFQHAIHAIIDRVHRGAGKKNMQINKDP